jgi:hypothetical protein
LAFLALIGELWWSWIRLRTSGLGLLGLVPPPNTTGLDSPPFIKVPNAKQTKYHWEKALAG